MNRITIYLIITIIFFVVLVILNSIDLPPVLQPLAMLLLLAWIFFKAGIGSSYKVRKSILLFAWAGFTLIGIIGISNNLPAVNHINEVTRQSAWGSIIMGAIFLITAQSLLLIALFKKEKHQECTDTSLNDENPPS